MSLTRREVTLIAAEAGIDVRTTKRLLSGKPSRSDATKAALVLALQRRGHRKLAAELVRRGRVTSQRHPSWNMRGQPSRASTPRNRKEQ